MLRQIPNAVRRLYSTVSDESVAAAAAVLKDMPTRGKKKRPTKADIVVLNPMETGVIKKVPHYFQQPTSPAQTDLWEIESSTKKLLVFKPQVPHEEAVASIGDLKPSSSVVSVKRFEQLTHVLESAYTVQQLKDYVWKHYPSVKIGRSSKKRLVNVIVPEKCWMIRASNEVDSLDDMITEKTFDLSSRDMYLILSGNGRIINNFTRVGATIAVLLNEKKIIVRATNPILRYVEVSMFKALNNVATTKMDNVHPGPVLDRIGSLTETYYEPLEGSTYMVSGWGKDKLSLAQRCMLWASQKHQHVSESLLVGQPVDSKPYPVKDNAALNWLDRGEQWFRNREPRKKGVVAGPTTVSQSIIDEVYKRLVSCVPGGAVSITPGQILSNNQRSIFSSKVTNITTKLMHMPLYYEPEVKDDIFTTADKNHYSVTIKFTPVDSDSPPLEMSLDLNEHDVADASEMRLMVPQREDTVLVSLPQAEADVKVTKEVLGQMDWTDDAGVAQWISQSNLDFSSRKKLHIPTTLELMLDGKPVKYQYIDVSYKRMLELKYEGFLVQYTVIEGGILGGKTIKVELFASEDDAPISKEQFSDFFTKVLRIV